MTKPLGLYVHIPFCLRKCNYCDFCSFADVDRDVRRRYIDALIREIRGYKREEKLALNTVFFGGGTPSLLAPDELLEIMEAVRYAFHLCDDTEITVEVNPRTLTEEKLAAFVACGVNRISIGLQTIHENERLMLGRIHDYDDFKRCYSMVKAAGIDNISVDLMYGIPEQTHDSFKETLDAVIKLKPRHISCYGLIIEEGTPFYKNADSLSLPDEDAECDMYELAARLLAENGYVHYEISNYARPGYESRHNLKYWRLDEYIGVGLNAHSFFEGKRYFNTDALSDYIQDAPREYTEVDSDYMAYDHVMLGLRLRSGISLSEYKKRFGRDLYASRRDTVDRLVRLGYMSFDGDRLALTERGFYVSNTILTELL